MFFGVYIFTFKSNYHIRGKGSEIKFLVHIHSLICDLPGKAMAILHKLFNGKFGCTVILVLPQSLAFLNL